MPTPEFTALCSDPRRKLDGSISLYLTSTAEFSKKEWLALAAEIGREERTVRLYPAGEAPQEPVSAPESPQEPPQDGGEEPLGPEKTWSQKLRGALWRKWEDDHAGEPMPEEWYGGRMAHIIALVREGRI